MNFISNQISLPPGKVTRYEDCNQSWTQSASAGHPSSPTACPLQQSKVELFFRFSLELGSSFIESLYFSFLRIKIIS